jgi:hypothetical protein
VKPARWVALAAGVLAVAASGWALPQIGALSAPVALRLAVGLAAAFILAVVLPVLWPAGLEPSGLERAVRTRLLGGPVAKLPALALLERQVVLATSGSGSSELHAGLRPVLRSIAAERLSVQYGVDLDGQPEQAQALLGAELWELVRADRASPEDRYGPGLPLGELQAMVEHLRSL